MRHTIIASLLNALVAAFIGLVVGIVLMFIYPIENAFQHLVTSSLVGIMIGTVSRLSAILMYHFGWQKIYWGYILTFFITLIGSILASLGQSLNCILIVLAIAEPLALLTAFLNITYAYRLNDGLKRKQALLREKSMQ